MFDANIMGSIIALYVFNQYSQFLYNSFGLFAGVCSVSNSCCLSDCYQRVLPVNHSSLQCLCCSFTLCFGKKEYTLRFLPFRDLINPYYKLLTIFYFFPNFFRCKLVAFSSFLWHEGK